MSRIQGLFQTNHLIYIFVIILSAELTLAEKTENGLKLKYENATSHVKNLMNTIDRTGRNDSFYSPSDEFKLKNLQNQMQEIEGNMTEIVKTMAENKTNESNIQARLIALENDLEGLSKQLLEDLQNLKTQEGDQVSKLIEVTSKNLEIVLHLKQMLKIVEEIENKKNLIEDILTGISDRNYYLATELLNKVDDRKTIFELINIVYKENLNNNIDVILDLVNKFQDFQKSLYIYKALYNEMEIHGHLKNVSKLFLFINSLKIHLFKQENVNTDIKHEGKILIGILEKKLESLGKDNLMDLFFHDDKNNGYHQASGIIFRNDFDLYEKIYYDFLSEIFTNETIYELLEFTKCRHHSDQRILGYSQIFKFLQHDNKTNDKSVITLANNLKIEEEYRFSTERVSDKIHYIKENLPKSVKNLIFSKKICIKEANSGEYLFAASGSDNEYLYDKERRHIFTWIPGGKLPQTYWTVRRINKNIFNIFNTVYDEHMYAAMFTYKKDKRYIFTWLRTDINEQGSWEIIPLGDDCYIKSIKFNEYLFSYKDKYDKKRRQVGTTSVSDALLPYMEPIKWSIEDCTKD